MTGHFGIGKTIAILQKYFYWPKMKHDIILYIKSCVACAIAKPSNRKLGLYLPLPIPDKPWHSISMDFMSRLLSSRRRNDFIYVVVDRFYKWLSCWLVKKLFQ